MQVTQTPYNTDDMAKEFLMEFHNSAFTVGQPYVFQFQDKPLTQVRLNCSRADTIQIVWIGYKWERIQCYS